MTTTSTPDLRISTHCAACGDHREQLVHVRPAELDFRWWSRRCRACGVEALEFRAEADPPTTIRVE